MRHKLRERPGGSSHRPRAEPNADRQRRLDALHQLALRQMAASPPPFAGHPAKPRSPARRAKIATATVIVLALLLVIVAVPATRNIGLNLLRRSGHSPIHTSSVASMAVYIVPDLPWSTISVDSKSIRPAIPGQQTPLLLPPGKHLITWQAEPFQIQNCSISVPSGRRDTCLIESGSVQFKSQPLARVVALPESLNNLASPESIGLLQMIQRSFATAPATLHAGEKFYSGVPPHTGANGPIYTASQPFSVSLSVIPAFGSGTPGFGLCQPTFPDNGPRPCSVSGENCFALCAVPWQTRAAENSLTYGYWDALVAVRLTRTFTSLDGNLTLPDSTLDATQGGAFTHLARVHIGWTNGKWQVYAVRGPDSLFPVHASGMQIAYDPGCTDALDLFSASANQFSRVQFISGNSAANGCLVIATPTSVSTQQRYLVRFGVVVLLQTDEQRVFPSAPMADAYARQIANQLNAGTGQSFT